mmetsp:Transcript_37328/g.78736  ORF Transcript_37328/g.78736 Transcript_37328/m.78736 type:complete len:374 (+) Transcript_37328:96-1217(+)
MGPQSSPYWTSLSRVLRRAIQVPLQVPLQNHQKTMFCRMRNCLYTIKPREDLKFVIFSKVNTFFNWVHGPSKSLDLTEIPSVTLLAGNCIRILALNPGLYTLHGTNTYLVGSGSTRLLIDSGAGFKKYIHLLQQVMQQQGVVGISDILISHGHGDHIGGVEQLRLLFPTVRVWKHIPMSDCDSHFNSTMAQRLAYAPLNDGQMFQTQGAQVQVITTPGHTNDHVSFYIKDSGVLFSGDCILGSNSSTVFTELKPYMDSLEKLKTYAPKVIYPGHGAVIENAMEKIQEYIAHRLKREKSVLQVLRQMPHATVPDLVDAIYQNQVPKHLISAASKSIQNHLDKLETEQKIKKILVERKTRLWIKQTQISYKLINN